MYGKLPIILDDYLEVTEQYCMGELSQEHLLNEAEWCYYNAIENSGSSAYQDYHTNSKKALKRYIDRLRSEGIKPSRDFYF